MEPPCRLTRVRTIDINAVAGLLAFFTATAGCLRVALRRRSGSVWWALAVLHALYALEILLDVRYRFRALAGLLLNERGWYASRADWQSAAIIAALLIGTTLVGWLWRRYRRDGAVLGAITGTALAFMLLAVETISLHRVDAMMYAQAGPLVALAWLWIGAAALVTASALVASPVR